MSTSVNYTDIVTAAYGLTIPDDQTTKDKIGRLIDKADLLLTGRLPYLSQHLAAGTVSQEAVDAVIEDMVLRVVRNPQAWRRMAVDDGSVELDTSIASGALTVTDQELDRLRPARRRTAVRSVRLQSPRWM